MKTKKVIVLGSGIFLVGLFVFFSIYPQNPGELPTVYQFTYGCIAKTPQYFNGYSYPSEKEALDYCYYNMRLSFLVIAYGVSGFFLIRYSLSNRN